MKTRHHIVVLDPISFVGGSKVATESILQLLDTDITRITVLTADFKSWKDSKFKRKRLYEPDFLSQKTQGIPYFIRHIIIAVQLLILRIRYGHIDITVGASGPGVDLALYLIKPFLKTKIVQLIHGPVAKSRTIGRCLLAASDVYYLESTQQSILDAISRFSNSEILDIPSCFHIMQNGLSDSVWPSICQTQEPVIFWAASLLKWKGLTTLLNALQNIDNQIRPLTNICYIQPVDTQLAITQAPVSIENVCWYENPTNIDQIRSSSNIFISTSVNEPFGLSILEAMAAGHCVLIPDDGAYWDRILTNNTNCIKYKANDVSDLADKIVMLRNNLELVIKLGNSAHKLALQYRADIKYAEIKEILENTQNTVTTEKLKSVITS